MASEQSSKPDGRPHDVNASSHSDGSDSSLVNRWTQNRTRNLETPRPPLNEGHAQMSDSLKPDLSFRERCRLFSWTWFTLTMATGGISNVIDSVNLRFRGLYAIGCIFFFLHIIFFLASCVMMSLRFYYWPKAFKAAFLHPTESLFVPAAVVALATVLTNIAEYGLKPGKAGDWLISTMIVLFWLYVGFAFLFSCGIYLLIWSTQVFTLETMTPAWIFPAYPLLLVGPFASKLTVATRGATGDHALQIIIGGLMVQGLGFMVTMMIYSAYIYRLMTHALPQEATRPAMFISVGPTGFTISALINLGKNFPSHVTPHFMGNGELAGQVAKLLANWTGLWLYGLMLFFFVTAVGAHWSCVSHGRMNFSMTWYGFIFPNTAFVTATFAVATALDNNFEIAVIGCVLTCILITVWAFIVGVNVRALALKQILWPQHGEDIDEEEVLRRIHDEQVRHARDSHMDPKKLDIEPESRAWRSGAQLDEEHAKSKPSHVSLGLCKRNMAANDTGLVPATASAEKSENGKIAKALASPECPPFSEKRSLSESEDRPIAPDQFDPRFETSKLEIWAYYSYYIGNNGLSLFNFAPTQAQNLLSLAAPSSGLLRFIGVDRTINSIILVSNGISFAIQIVVFLILGSYADFGSWRPNILIALSLVAYGIGFGWMGVHTPDKWRTGIGLYIVGLIAYQTTLTFWTAAFPGLARNTRELREKASEYENGEITRDEYDRADTMQRSRLSNIAFTIQSLGEIVILAVIVGVLFGVNVDASDANNSYGLSVLIAFATGVWLLVSLPWFILEKRRKGRDPGMNIVFAGIWQLKMAAVKIWKLKQSLFYLIGYFLLGDSLNTTVTVIATLQNAVVEYNTLELTYLLLVGIACQAVGIYGFWLTQKYFNLDTKTMFNAVAVGIIVLDGWGMVGIWQQNFGFHNTWEFWLYQSFYGLAVCPWYSYSQIMISEVTPRGHEFLFFSLFSIIGKTSSFIGPIVSSAIIDASPTNNNSTPFYFLFGLSLASFLFLLIFVDLKKSRIEQAKFLEEEARARAKTAGSGSDDSLDDEVRAKEQIARNSV
ncbi:MAG: hypothetical protein M1828_000492 [Chrysothrix sp. TS-e1954]|nr:MAG: hypothetical protein M1828_000492 [Chrysothrix sp. TS-e1954]